MESWKRLVDQVGNDGHGVVYYTDETFLARTVGYYAGEGLSAGESVLLLPRRCHAELLERAIELQTARPVSDWIAEGSLVILEAEGTLSRFTRRGELDWPLFEREVGKTMAALGKRKRVRAHGEMVNLLWHWGERDAALLLEHYWNRVLQFGNSSLLCAYQIDPLSADVYDEKYHSVCGCHTAIISAENTRHFEQSIHERMQRVLGMTLTSTVKRLATMEDQRDSIPEGHKCLLWLSRHMPATTKRILSRNGAHHAPAVPVSMSR